MNRNRRRGRAVGYPGRRGRTRRGTAAVYTIIVMTVMIGFASLAVDVGRVEVAKTQLQTAADAAARQAALVVNSQVSGQWAAPAAAAAAAARNLCDGTPVVLNTSADVDMGYWTDANRTFVVVADPTVANAIRVTARRSAARGTGIPLLFAQILGRPTCDVQAQSIALLVPGSLDTPTVAAHGNPWLTGQPPNVSASNNNPDNAPDWSAGTSGQVNCSTAQANLAFVAGDTITFDGVTGTVANDPPGTMRTAEGNAAHITDNYDGAEHGLSDLNCPICALVGVFISDATPGAAAAPPELDFSSASSREFTSLSPQLYQTFFIGDGQTSGGTVQRFIVPAGATRLYLGVMDGWHWGDNPGQFQLNAHAPKHVRTVN